MQLATRWHTLGDRVIGEVLDGGTRRSHVTGCKSGAGVGRLQVHVLLSTSSLLCVCVVDKRVDPCAACNESGVLLREDQLQDWRSTDIAKEVIGSSVAGAVCTVMKLVGVFHGRHLMKIWNGTTRKFNAHSCWEGAEEMEVTDAGVRRTEFGASAVTVVVCPYKTVEWWDSRQPIWERGRHTSHRRE